MNSDDRPRSSPPLMLANNITIVLGEDDDGHALLIEKNLVRIGLGDRFVRKRDGREVLEYFATAQAGKNTESTHVLLLDIKMPHLDGIAVLEQLKRDPGTAMLPVIMLTTTDDSREVARCYELGCNVYVTKPIVYEQFVDVVARLGMFLSIVEVPELVGRPA